MSNSQIGIIAGNRKLPLQLVKRIKEKKPDTKIKVFAFKGETSLSINRYADKINWLDVCKLKSLAEALEREKITDCIMIGQINPLRIFKQKNWDDQLRKVVQEAGDFRPHSIFSAIIAYLRLKGINFLDSTSFLKDDLADSGVMNDLEVSKNLEKDIDFGQNLISRFVELDTGQTIVIKDNSVVALESLEGTDRTIKRGFKLAGAGCTILKFSKHNQDLRFDVPVVGVSTLRLLRSVKAASLVLEENKVIILDKERFLSLAKKWNMPVVGKGKYFASK